MLTLFRPVAPALDIFPAGKGHGRIPAAPEGATEGALQVVRKKYYGFPSSGSSGVYREESSVVPAAKAPVRAEDLFEEDADGGIRYAVPLALYADGKGTYPRPEKGPAASPGAGAYYSGDDRPVRLADVILAWNVLEHFYPYFDVVTVDWDAVLGRSLAEAAMDKDGAAFYLTLSRMLAAVQDGHVTVRWWGSDTTYSLPLLWDWVEGKLVVTWSDPVASGGLRPGDVILEVDGKPSEQAIADAEAFISAATPERRRHQALIRILLRGPRDSECRLVVQPASGAVRSVTARRAMEAKGPEELGMRPPKVHEIRPGFWYVDLTRTTDKDFESALPRLAQAKGILYDMRGYPSTMSHCGPIAYSIDSPVESAKWNIPIWARPHRQGLSFQTSSWPLRPKKPRLTKNVVYLVNDRAISYAETWMGIIEHYKLAQIVGTATAGTNGNVTSFHLPGGYGANFTGMQVLKQDGTRHHGVGIRPTVRVEPTLGGIRAGKDDVLEKGLELLINNAGDTKRAG